MDELREAKRKLIQATGSLQKANEIIEQLAKEVRAGAYDGEIGMMIYQMRKEKRNAGK